MPAKKRCKLNEHASSQANDDEASQNQANHPAMVHQANSELLLIKYARTHYFLMTWKTFGRQFTMTSPQQFPPAGHRSNPG